MRSLLVIMAALAVSSCGAEQTEQLTATDVAENASNYVAEVSALSTRERDAVFYRAIHDAGLPCQQVVSSEEVTATDGTPTWRAQCEDGAPHLILVKPDGSAQVISNTRP